MYSIYYLAKDYDKNVRKEIIIRWTYALSLMGLFMY